MGMSLAFNFIFLIDTYIVHYLESDRYIYIYIWFSLSFGLYMPVM